MPQREYAAVQATFELTDNEAVRRSLSRCRKLFAKTQAEYGQKTGYIENENIRGILELESTWLETADQKDAKEEGASCET